jgi:hypothetical protein
MSSEAFINFRNKLIFYGEELLAPRQAPKLEDHRLSAALDCLFNIFSSTLHIWRPSLPDMEGVCDLFSTQKFHENTSISKIQCMIYFLCIPYVVWWYGLD